MKLRYALKRILWLIPTFFGVTILAYFISALAPGTPLDFLIDPNSTITASEYEALRHQYGMDQPVIIQYLSWLSQLLQGNWGISFRTSEPVLGMILSRLGPTLLITVTSVVIAVLISIPLGILAAVKPYSWIDYIATGLSFLTAAIPHFFTGLVFIYIFAVQFRVFPTGGMYTSAGDHGFLTLIQHMVLPTFVLVFQEIGGLIQQMRGSMLEVMEEDYIRTARAKGLLEYQVIIHHAIGNALIPLVTTIGMMIPFIIGGAVVTEQIFGWPGLGTLMIQSINARDYPCIMGITVFVTFVVLIGNLVTDIIYGFLDPRISYK